MKTHENGMFIALKYGAAAMAGATAYHLCDVRREASILHLEEDHEDTCNFKLGHL